MRPARKGPENPGRSHGTRYLVDASFNEAGPQGAGKPVALPSAARVPLACFNEAGPQGAGKPKGSTLSSIIFAVLLQ